MVVSKGNWHIRCVSGKKNTGPMYEEGRPNERQGRISSSATRKLRRSRGSHTWEGIKKESKKSYNF